MLEGGGEAFLAALPLFFHSVDLARCPSNLLTVSLPQINNLQSIFSLGDQATSQAGKDQSASKLSSDTAGPPWHSLSAGQMQSSGEKTGGLTQPPPRQATATAERVQGLPSEGE